MYRYVPFMSLVSRNMGFPLNPITEDATFPKKLLNFPEVGPFKGV